ncbi:enoyl-CoA hydratase/isomerase family protein [Piscinibacter sakaiensis]|uniref:enoyl-CoA hydratase/isomerase family protein n=1 Tax=Piscinibacter sakaiensis TaxID=1547922 RepID=UPI003AAD448D
MTDTQQGRQAGRAGEVRFEPASDGVARVVLANPGKLNAIDIAMWQTLRTGFEELQAMPADSAPIAVIVSGANGQFAAGGDIAEFAEFRFDEERLRDFHEQIVGPALDAIRNCDIPLFAQIDGACVGGGLEIAACCDIRICGETSRFGAPIGRLGFPMAPGELQLMCGIAPQAVLREMLLEARLIDAATALRCGLVHQVTADADVAAVTQARAQALHKLAPQAARINKRTLRQIARGGPDAAERLAHYRYADSAEHREGVTAFINRRPPRFGR